MHGLKSSSMPRPCSHTFRARLTAWRPVCSQGAARYRAEHVSRKGEKVSCAACHGIDPRQPGRTRVAKLIERLPGRQTPGEDPISTEIAEVTVIAVWREMQNIQKKRPEKRPTYRPAQELSDLKNRSENSAGRG